MEKTTKQWKELRTKLQFKEIPVEEIPRLLYECMLDREAWELRARNAVKFVDELKTKIEKDWEE